DGRRGSALWCGRAPGVRAPAPVPPARRFGAALAAGRVRVPAAAAAALCPGRFVTYTDVQASYGYKQDQWHYSKQFCKPGVSSPREPAAQVLRDGDCPSMIIPSRPQCLVLAAGAGAHLAYEELTLAVMSLICTVLKPFFPISNFPHL
ncbi:uncharacterized protein ACIB01_001531, partial [Guaruba guarouba]